MRFLRASGLLQRHYHPTYHHRHHPVKIKISQLWVSWRPDAKCLTQSLPCRQDTMVISEERLGPTAGVKSLTIGKPRIAG